MYFDVPGVLRHSLFQAQCAKRYVKIDLLALIFRNLVTNHFFLAGFHHVFHHVWLSLVCNNIIESKRDSICLCFYFAFMMSGTTRLVSVYTRLMTMKPPCRKHHVDFWELLMILDREDEGGGEAFPRYQTNGVRNDIYQKKIEKILVHSDRFMKKLTSGSMREDDVFSHIMEALNQFDLLQYRLKCLHMFHALAISGVIPFDNIHYTEVHGNYGPMKLLKWCSPQQKVINGRFENVYKKFCSNFSNLITRRDYENVLCKFSQIIKKKDASSLIRNLDDVAQLRTAILKRNDSGGMRPDVLYFDDNLQCYMLLCRFSESHVTVRSDDGKSLYEV